MPDKEKIFSMGGPGRRSTQLSYKVKLVSSPFPQNDRKPPRQRHAGKRSAAGGPLKDFFQGNAVQSNATAQNRKLRGGSSWKRPQLA